MSGTASASFFWNDYDGASELRVCSLAAQGLWMRMLCLAGQAPKFGYVMVAGRYASPDDIAAVVGKPLDEVTAYIAELERNAVFARDRNKNIYCRRMVRDAKKRAASKKGGKIGGQASLDKQTGIHATRAPTRGGTRNATPHPKARASSFSSSFSKEEATTAPRSEPKDRLERVCAALGVALTDNPSRLNWPAQLAAMIEAGLDIEGDILPACAEAKARGIANLQWVRKRAEAEKAKRSIVASMPVPIEYTDDNGWRQRLKLFIEGMPDQGDGLGTVTPGLWLPKWGPQRGQPGHLCPEELWAKYDTKVRAA